MGNNEKNCLKLLLTYSLLVSQERSEICHLCLVNGEFFFFNTYTPAYLFSHGSKNHRDTGQQLHVHIKHQNEERMCGQWWSAQLLVQDKFVWIFFETADLLGFWWTTIFESLLRIVWKTQKHPVSSSSVDRNILLRREGEWSDWLELTVRPQQLK